MIRGGLLLLAIYILSVGWQGKGTELIDDVEADIGGFGAWIAAWAFLMLLRATPAKPVVDPIIWLAVLSTVLARWNNISADAKESYKVITK